MIYVPRSDVPTKEVAESLVKPVKCEDGNLPEIEAARNFYSKDPPPVKSFEFKRYKEEAVCFELDRLFRGKCAYCESVYSAIDSKDIEHFRPKGGVTGIPQSLHQGYWWLAAEWINLLVSCPPCNQHRKQAIYRFGMTDAEIKAERLKTPVERRGKGCHFPLTDETKRAIKETDSLNLEDPLLINPALKNPNKHLEWIFDWDRSEVIWEADDLIADVVPKTVGGIEDPYGIASIAIYGLDRIDLFRSRVTQLRIVQGAVSSLFETVADISECKPEKKAALEARLKKKKLRLKQLCSRTSAYTAMTRAFVRLAFLELEKLAKLTK
jgi:uncharacterized protein (TIGR02646 family)